MTWAAVAEQMHYANGSVARRAAMRYETKQGTPTIVAAPRPAVVTEPIILVDTKHFTVDEATRYVEQIIERHGHPNWIAYVPIRVRNMVPQATLSALMAAGRSSDQHTTRDGCSVILQWCADNVFEMISIGGLAAIGGVSRGAVRKLMADNVGMFRKSDGGTFEIRDPQADRTIDRRTA